LWRARHRAPHLPLFHHPCTQDHPQQFENGLVTDRRDSLSWPQEGGLKWPHWRGRRGVVMTV
jgi:hypothetical protein